MLTPEYLQELIARIDGRRFHLEAELRKGVDMARDNTYGALAGETHTAGDEAVADVIVDTGHAAQSRDLQELRALEAARHRIDAGEYGECVDCAEDIGIERLRAQLDAIRCLRCQRAYDKTHRQAPMPSL